MKKTYTQPALHIFLLASAPLLTALSDGDINLKSGITSDANADEAASRGSNFDDEDW